MAQNTKNLGRKKGPMSHKVLSDRGVWLEQRHNANQDSNVNHGMPAFSFLNDQGQSIAVKVGDKCPICRKHVRGLNHEDGDHHKGVSTKHRSR